MSLEKIKLNISDEIRAVLLEIEDSMVAKLLLADSHNREDLVDDYVDFISVSKKDNTKISYLTKERSVGLTEEECFSTSKRIFSKPGGFVSKVFKNIAEREIEKFSNLYRSEILKPKLFYKVYSGDDIKKYYLYSSYSQMEGGSLHASCMKYDSCQNFFDIYTKNPNCKLLAVRLNTDSESDPIIGRALLWDIYGYKIMDRIYTINDETYSYYFKKWASKNGYMFKTQQNWFNSKYFQRLGEEPVKLHLKIKLDYKMDYYPYMDTFKFLDKDGYLTNVQPDGSDFFTLTDAGGRRHNFDYLVNDFKDDVYRYRHGDVTRLDYLGENKWTDINNCYYSYSNDRWILKENSFYSEELGDYIFNSEYEELNDKEAINYRLSRKGSRFTVDSFINSVNFGSPTPITEQVTQENEAVGSDVVGNNEVETNSSVVVENTDDVRVIDVATGSIDSVQQYLDFLTNRYYIRGSDYTRQSYLDYIRGTSTYRTLNDQDSTNQTDSETGPIEFGQIE